MYFFLLDFNFSTKKIIILECFLFSGPSSKIFLLESSGINRMSHNPSEIPQVSGNSRQEFQLLMYLCLSACQLQGPAAVLTLGSATATRVLPAWVHMKGYTRVVECECGCGWGRVLFCPLLGKVLKEWSEVRPPMVLGIIVMVFGVMSGMSSGERLMARV